MSGGRTRQALLYGVVFAGFLGLHLLLYHGLWHNTYYKDDYQWIVDARDVNRSLGALLHPNPDNAQFLVRPTQRLLFALVYRFAGKEPAPYYIVGLILHSIAATMVFALLRALLARVQPPPGRRPRAQGAPNDIVFALAGALFFAASANHSVAVLWIAAQSSLLVTMALLALFLYVLRNAPRLQERRVFGATVALFILSLYCKNLAVSMPAALVLPLLWDTERHSPARRAALTLLAVLSLLAAGQVLFTRLQVGHFEVAPARASDGSAAFALSWNVVLNFAGTFLGCFLAPQQYARLLNRIPFPSAALALFCAWVVVAWRSPYRRPMAFGLVWMLVAAIPTSLFAYLQYSAGQTVANRYEYLPMVGAAVLVTFTLRWILHARRYASLMTLACVAAYVAVQYRPLQAKRQHFNYYSTGRMSWIAGMVNAARGMVPVTVIYAINWKEDDALVRAVSRLYIEDSGCRLAGWEEYSRLVPDDPGDGVERYMAVNDEQTHMMRFSKLASMRLRPR